MKKFNYFMMFTALVGLASFTACERNANPETSQSAVKFTGDVNNMSKTRAAGTAWADGDAIGIFMVNATPAVVEGAANRKYITVDDTEQELNLGDFNPDGAANTIFYPMNPDTRVGFIAYYPYRQTINTLGIYEIQIPLEQTDENQPLFDLLYVKTPIEYHKESERVDLVFDHKLSKVVFNVLTPTAETGVTVAEFAEMEVIITNSLTATTLDLATNIFGVMGVDAPTKTRKLTVIPSGSSAAYDAIVLPTNYTSLNVTFTIPASLTNPAAGTYTLTLEAPTFAPGSVHTYNVRVTRTGIVVENSTITDWIPGGTTDGITAN